MKGVEELQTIVQSMNRSTNGDKKKALEVILRKKEVLITLLEETNQELKGFVIDSAVAQKERDIIEKEDVVLQEALQRAAQVRDTLEKSDLPPERINFKSNNEKQEGV